MATDAYTKSLERRVRELERRLERHTSIPLRLDLALKRQKVSIETAQGQAFVAGWLNTTGRTALQIPLLLDEPLRGFYAAGFYARRG